MTGRKITREDFEIPWWYDYNEGDHFDRLNLIEKMGVVQDFVGTEEEKRSLILTLNSLFDDCLSFAFHKKSLERLNKK